MIIDMEKQTAVEWLQEAITKKLTSELGPYFLELFDNAKAIEKEQIEKSFQDGMDKGYYVGGGKR
jgi:hypothetical protein